MKQSSVLSIAVLFALSQPTIYAQTYTVIHNFGSNANDPFSPAISGTITQSRGGAMFSTVGGGNDGTLGAAFRITTSGAVTTLETFHPGQRVPEDSPWPPTGSTMALPTTAEPTARASSSR